jgi:oxygen-independent coproporphyrinogen-3 oxidase
MLMDETPKTGYEHYEISNFAKPGFHSLHNSSYWNNTPYLGLGAGAHSYDLITRKENTADIERYINLLCENKSAFSVERLTSDTRYNEFIMIRLRTRQGIDLQVLILQYGQQYYDYCMHNAAKYIETGLLTIDNNCLILTRQGIFVADSIIAELMIAQ